MISMQKIRSLIVIIIIIIIMHKVHNACIVVSEVDDTALIGPVIGGAITGRVSPNCNKCIGLALAS
jgi:hypothetical protein